MSQLAPLTVDVLRPADAASYVALSVATIARLRKKGEFPAPFKLTRVSLAFHKADLDAWIKLRRSGI